MVYVTGKTFDFKGLLADNGGKWDASRKAWAFEGTAWEALCVRYADKCGYAGVAGKFARAVDQKQLVVNV